MKVIICGAGQVGWQIARQLSNENNDVTVVDNNPALVRRAMDTLDVQGVEGFASYPDVLSLAGARDADMIIAATHSDEVNMVICQVAHSAFGVSRKIARLRAQSYLTALYSDLYRRDHMPIDVVISPEVEVAQAALRRLSSPAAFDTQDFLDGQAQLVGFQLDEDCPVLETSLKELSELFSTLRATVVAIRRQGKLFSTKASDQLFAEDEVYLFVQKDDFSRALEIFGKPQPKLSRVSIMGGGNVGLQVAQALEERTERVRTNIIEKNRAVAEVAADQLERTIVLNGDALDQDLLKEAGVARADAVLCVTDDDKVNMLSAVRAKQSGCTRAICLINDPSLIPIISALDIDAYINPRATTVSSILRHVRHGRVRNVYSVGESEAEVIEAQVLPSSSICGPPLRELNFPEGALIGAISKSGTYVSPKGDTILEEGDVITIFALSSDVPDVENLLQVSIEYF